MFNFRAKGGFGVMHQATSGKQLTESPFLQSNQYQQKVYSSLDIGVTWTEDRWDGKVKCTGAIKKLEPAGISSPPKLTLKDFSNGREVVTWLKGGTKYKPVAKELKFSSGPNKGKVVTREKILEIVNT